MLQSGARGQNLDTPAGGIRASQGTFSSLPFLYINNCQFKKSKIDYYVFYDLSVHAVVKKENA